MWNYKTKQTNCTYLGTKTELPRVLLRLPICCLLFCAKSSDQELSSLSLFPTGVIFKYLTPKTLNWQQKLWTFTYRAQFSKSHYLIWRRRLILFSKRSTECVITSYNAAPHSRYKPHPTEPAQYTICSNTVFFLLKMGIMLPETCWDRSW